MCAGIGERGYGFVNLDLKRTRIDLRNQLAGFDRRVEIGVDGLDWAGDVAADLHRRDGIDRAGGDNRADDRPARYARGDVAVGGGTAPH